MINTKRFFISYTSGQTLSFAAQRVLDGFYLQADGSFAAPFYATDMTETMTGGYSYDETRFAWDNGLYDVVFYDLGSAIVGFGAEITVAQDQIMNSVSLTALAAKNAVSQVQQALGLIQKAISDMATKIDLLQGQVNDYSFQSRRVGGN